jgi:hypothetical protein
MTHPLPFALSLSKGCSSFRVKKGQGFDRLSPNGLCVVGGSN